MLQEITRDNFFLIFDTHKFSALFKHEKVTGSFMNRRLVNFDKKIILHLLQVPKI